MSKQNWTPKRGYCQHLFIWCLRVLPKGPTIETICTTALYQQTWESWSVSLFYLSNSSPLGTSMKNLPNSNTQMCENRSKLQGFFENLLRRLIDMLQIFNSLHQLVSLFFYLEFPAPTMLGIPTHLLTILLTHSQVLIRSTITWYGTTSTYECVSKIVSIPSIFLPALGQAINPINLSNYRENCLKTCIVGENSMPSKFWLKKIEL